MRQRSSNYGASPHATPGIDTVREWSDDPEPGEDTDEWPCPDEHTESVVTGELAERVRRALGVEDTTVPVMLTETAQFGGSEYTLEKYETFWLTCGDRNRGFEDLGGTENAFAQLLDWLDQYAPKAKP